MRPHVPALLRTTLALLTTAALAAGGAVAQALPDAAEDALFAARSAMQQAIAQDVDPYPDRPLWAEAIREARRAVELAPTHPRTLGTLAEAYSRTNFYARAWDAWQAYLAAGHGLDAQQAPMFLRVGEEYAYSFYERGDRARAADVHLSILDAVPFSKESRVWMGRIRLEQERPADAIPYWEAVTRQDPDDARAAYFLDLARDQARWGVRAAGAFRDGVSDYEAGDMDAAARNFERATDANDAYAEAWAWRGRVAFEAQQWLVARTFYARASELAPDDATYAYFRDEAQRRLDAADAAEAAAAQAADAAADAAEADTTDDAPAGDGTAD